VVISKADITNMTIELRRPTLIFLFETEEKIWVNVVFISLSFTKFCFHLDDAGI